ncbi:MAG: DAK2 domain-containing protein [Acidimicrobiia bacterium]
MNRLNVYPVPDGDTGTNLALTASAIASEVEGISELADVCDAVAHGSLMGARGNSGVILSQILRGITNRLRAEESLNAQAMASALADGADEAYSSVLRPQEGTMLTVIREAARAAQRAAHAGAESAVLDAAYEQGELALRRTPELLPVLREAGVVDAGGAGVLLLLAAFAEEAGGESPALPDDLLRAVPAGTIAAADEPFFEVILLLDANETGISELRDKWSSLGDSVVTVGVPGAYKCHLHTSSVGPAIEAALDVGRAHDIEVNDLRDLSFQPIPGSAAADIGVVAVVEGRGLVETFRQLGAQAVVKGGAALNPSTSELLAGVEVAPASEVVLLPNHPDVLPAAALVDGLTPKRVHLVPTRSMTEGIAAMVAYQPELEAAETLRRMTEAAARITDGTVREVAEGDWIGRSAEEVLAAGGTPAEALLSLLERIVPPQAELVTMILGLEAENDATEQALGWLEVNRPQTATETAIGEQPVYAYYISVE